MNWVKRPFAVSLDKELIEWINSRIKEDNSYRNKSHLVEDALNKFKNNLADAEKKLKEERFEK